MHRVAACAGDDSGRLHLSVGDVETPVFLRSSAKPFIAASVIAAGARDAFGLTQPEIAVMAASHNGQPFHVEAVASILRKIGAGVKDLQCGTHLPYDEATAEALIRAGEAPSALYNNCSGKHAGILALCKLIGADASTYLDAGNPAQRHILAFCARMSDDDPASWPVAIDGCGIPVYATSLRRAALAFARFATLRGLSREDAAALQIVRDAMIAYPAYVSGTAGFDTALMEAGDGDIACKVGAEGVHVVAAISKGLGYASKVVDGASRGRAPATLEAMRALGVLDDRQLTKLAAFGRPVLYNRAGRVVGEIRCRPIVAIEKAR